MLHLFTRISTTISYTLIAMFVVTACNQNSTTPSSNEKLIIGLEGSYPPFEFMDSNDQLVGFDLDVARAVAKELNKELEIKVLEFDSLILSLKQGKIDAVISGMSITPDRLKEINMVPYYGDETTHFSLLFWKTIPAGVSKLQDLAAIPNATVCVEAGTVFENYLLSYPEIQLRSLQSTLQSLMDVKYGKSIAYLVDPKVAAYLKAQHSELQALEVPLSPEERPLGLGIAIRKNDLQRQTQIEEAIQKLKSLGTLEQLEQQWFAKEEHNVF
jgi:arginine transport system substrate-binding protein